MKNGLVKWKSAGWDKVYRDFCLLEPGQTRIQAKQSDASDPLDRACLEPFLRGNRWFGPPPRRQVPYIPELQNRFMPLQIVGDFDGDLSSTAVEIDGAPIVPLAESEREVLIVSPGSPGLHNVVVHDRSGFRASQTVRFYEIGTIPDQLEDKQQRSA